MIWIAEGIHTIQVQLFWLDKLYAIINLAGFKPCKSKPSFKQRIIATSFWNNDSFFWWWASIMITLSVSISVSWKVHQLDQRTCQWTEIVCYKAMVADCSSALRMTGLRAKISLQFFHLSQAARILSYKSSSKHHPHPPGKKLFF